MLVLSTVSSLKVRTNAFRVRCCIVINLADNFNIINYEKDIFKPKTFTQRLKLESFMLTASPGVSDDEFDPSEGVGAKEEDFEED